MALKLLDLPGLKALSSVINQIRKTAGDNSSAVSDLKTDLAGLSETVTQAVTELDQSKADAIVKRSFVLEISGWTEDRNGSEKYPYKYSFALSGANTRTRVDAVLSEGSEDVAAACKMSRRTETSDGSVTFRSGTMPSGAISGELCITQLAGT